MAIATASFSIREYAARMRSVDYDKCWPFAQERAARSLPPMPVRRFRWWEDELQVTRSGGDEAGEDCNLADPVTEASLDVSRKVPVEVGVAGDGEALGEEKKMKTPKPLPPPASRVKQRTSKKKRSILELIAVAPPIDTVGPGKNQGKESGLLGGMDLLALMERKKKRRVKEDIEVDKNLKVKRKMMKKKKHKVEICAAKKDKSCKFKMLPLVDMCKILLPEQSGKLHKKLVHNHMKPRTIRALLVKHSRRLGRTSKIDFRNVDVAKAPVRSILMKRKKIVASTKKRKAVENIMGSDPADICFKQSKHSSFSQKDIIVHDQSCLPLQQSPHLQPLSKIVSDVLVASSDLGNLNENPSLTGETNWNVRSVELNLSDSGFVKNNFDIGETSSEKQLNGSYGHDTTTSLPLLKTSAEMDLNHSSQDFIDLNCNSWDTSTSTHGSMYSVRQRTLSPSNEGDFGSFIGTHHVISSCNSSGQSVLISDNQHAMPCFNKGEMDLSERQTHLNEHMTDLCDYFPVMHGIPESMVIGTRSSIGSKVIVEPSPNREPIWRGICPEQGFTGLPLNSQGELIQFHHGNMHGKMPNSALNPLHGIASLSHSQPQSKRVRTTGKFQSPSIFNEDDQHWFSKHYYPAGAVLISFDSVKFQGLDNLRYHPHANDAQVCSCHSRQIEMCCGRKDFLVAEDCQDMMNSYAESELELGLQPTNQPTMRLMGKNITVGSCSKEHHLDRKIWTNKDMLRMSCRTSRVHNRSISKSWRNMNMECIMHAESEKSRELPVKSLGASSLYRCMSADKLTSNQMRLAYESNFMFKDGFSTGKSYNFHADCSASPIPYQSVWDKTCRPAVHYIPEAKSMNEEQQRTFLSSDSQNFYQHVLPNSTHCRHCQNLSYTIQSTLHPHYINQVPVQTSRCLSSKKAPNHLQNEVCQAPPLIPYCPVLVRQFCSVAEDNHFAYGFPHTRSVFSYPSGHCSVSPAYGACTPMSAVYSSPAASETRDNLISHPSTYGYNFEARDEMEFNFSHVKVLDRSKGSIKRPTIRDDKVMEITKKPNLKFQEDSNAHTSVRREQLHGDQKDNRRASEINACVSSMDAIDVRLPVANGQKDAIVIAGESFASKSSQIRSGPVKLSAGAKHILKPNGSLDQENYCPIYISVPFTQVNIAGKGSVSQDKAAEPCEC